MLIFFLALSVLILLKPCFIIIRYKGKNIQSSQVCVGVIYFSEEWILFYHLIF